MVNNAQPRLSVSASTRPGNTQHAFREVASRHEREGIGRIVVLIEGRFKGIRFAVWAAVCASTRGLPSLFALCSRRAAAGGGRSE